MPYKPKMELRSGTLSMASTGVMADTPTAVAAVSRTVLGPRMGNTMYGPDLSPHTPKVVPKSLLMRCAPCLEATSKQPPRPAVVLNSTRPVVLKKSCPRACKKLLAADQMSRKLLEILRIHDCAGWGVRSAYIRVTGLIRARSTLSLKV